MIRLRRSLSAAPAAHPTMMHLRGSFGFEDDDLAALVSAALFAGPVGKFWFMALRTH